MGTGERLWRRPGNEAAIGTKLLSANIPVCFSELDLEGALILPYEFGMAAGRMAARGSLGYDMHPDNFAFNGESLIAMDFGELTHVELTAAAFLPWLADMRATWNQGLEGLLAGFIQGLRVTTATEAPNLAHELVEALGGRRVNEPEWPLSNTLAEALFNVKILQEGTAELCDCRSFQEISMDDDERVALGMLARVAGTRTEDLLARPVSLKTDFMELSKIPKAMNVSKENRRQLWLFVFMLAELGNKICKDKVNKGVSMLQAAHIALQIGASDCRYFESLFAFCTQREGQQLRSPTVRRSEDEVFLLLGYATSYAVTCLRLFRSSVELVKRGDARNALWTSAWIGMHRIRACEGAFAGWARQDQGSFEKATPVLQMLASTQASLISNIASTLEDFLRRSVFLPWVCMAQKEIPNIKSEFEWCRELLAIVKDLPNRAAQLAKHFDRLSAAVDLKYPGMQGMSFISS
jgi:hypothetical protein